jgi:acyl-CoA reductase-like NAD-dependent aldehyde dehydrogenase
VSVHSANTEQLIGVVPRPDSDDLDAAVLAARAAFDDPSDWSHSEPAARAAALRRLADAIDRRTGRIAARVSDQDGMPITLATAVDAAWPGQMLRLYAAMAAGQSGDEIRASSTGRCTLVRRLPVGVVVGIVPWNYPNTLASLQYAPALATGCTVVIKPSPETALDAMYVAEAVIEAGLPPGVLNIVPGGRDAGAYLVAHPAVDKVTFTGSTAAGRQIGEVCGRLLRPATLELGGKSAAIVLDDADLGSAAVAANLAPALFANNGQTCFLTSRVPAPRSRYGQVVDAIADLARSLVVGSSLDPATQMGPLVSERQRALVEGYIAAGAAQGAPLVTGGPPRRASGSGRWPRPSAANWALRPFPFPSSRCPVRFPRRHRCAGRRGVERGDAGTAGVVARRTYADRGHR